MPDLLSGAEPDITRADQVRCVEREIKMREKVYPIWVEQKKMTEAAAAREIAVMKSILVMLNDSAS